MTDVQEGTDHASFTVRPSHDPADKNSCDAGTEHFFKSSATGTFEVEKKANKRIASETGINESVNNKDPEAGNRNLLNTVISEAGWPFKKHNGRTLLIMLSGIGH